MPGCELGNAGISTGHHIRLAAASGSIFIRVVGGRMYQLNSKKCLGILLVSLPFVGITISGVIEIGWAAMAGVWAIVATILGLTTIGISLMHDSSGGE